MPELAYINALFSLLCDRFVALRHEEQGSVTTEQVIVTAVLAALAIATTAIIVTKVTAKANSIPLQ